MTEDRLHRVLDINTPVAFVEMHKDTRVNNKIISKKRCMYINFPKDDISFALFTDDDSDIGFIGDKIILFIINNKHQHLGIAHLHHQLMMSGYHIIINDIRYDPLTYNTYSVLGGNIYEPGDIMIDLVGGIN